MMPLDDRKQAVRAAARLVLQGCDPAAGTLVGQRVLASGLIQPGMVVAGFLPLGHEVDIAPLLRALRDAGHIVGLPRTPPRGQPLTFHRWGHDDPLRPERFGTQTSDGPEIAPDLLLVSMLAFDRCCHRLGYGGGYYDRTLAARPGIRAIGCAHAAQERDDIPTGPTDLPLGWIATERELIAAAQPRAVTLPT
jgi:5-formyltetrahydrofolate cyclo-ligase